MGRTFGFHRRLMLSRAELESRAVAAIRTELARRQADRENARLSEHDPAHFGWWLSDSKWVRPPHLQLIPDRIAAHVETGNGRLIIAAPPRHGKSSLVSETVPAWRIRVIQCSYGATFAETWGAQSPRHAGGQTAAHRALDRWRAGSRSGRLADRARRLHDDR
jgi:hypothetical protein